jgi:hypothetical protein
VALSSGETVLVFLYNVEKVPKQLCELNIKGGLTDGNRRID